MSIQCSKISLEKLNNQVYDSYYLDGIQDGWEDKDKRFNFYHLFQITPTFENQSVLDVGCGTGDMVKYLPKNCKYLGIDIYRPALKIAKVQFPNHVFKFGNILTFKSKPFDYVLCSGALSINLNGENYNFLEKALTKMWSLCKRGVSFNVLTNERFRNSRKSHLYLYNADKVGKICKKFSDKTKSLYTPIDDYNDGHTFYLWK